MRFFSFFEYEISSAMGRTLDLLCKVVDTTSPTLSIWQCPPRCQHVESRARWMLAVTSCCSAAQRKVFPHRPTPGRSWTRCPGCRTTPCKVLQTSWPSEFPFAPPSLVNLTHIAELRLSNNPTISATCHVLGPPKGPPPSTPTDPAEGWWWMDGSDSNHVNLWMSVCVCVSGPCLWNQPRWFCVCGGFFLMFFLILSCWIPTLAHLVQTLAIFVLHWTSSISCGCTASNSAKRWVHTHPAPLRKFGFQH